MGNPLNYLYEAVGWVLTRIYDVLSPLFGASSGWTWALSIVILVIFMRLIMVPLFIKQMHTTRAMTSLQPKMAELRKKYKNDKQTLNQETMKLYQEAGVNPLMGCLPVVAQLPVFFALFSVLKAIAEWKPGQIPKYGLTEQMVESASHAKILGVTIADKFLFSHGVPLHAKLVILATVLVSMATTYLTVRQSMKRGMMPAATPDNPMGNAQKYMAYVMPFFALTGLYWPFGLVLYWVTTNLWTLLQQWALFKRYPYTPPAPAGAGAAAPALAPRSSGSKAPARPRAKPGSSTPAKPSAAKPSAAKPSAAKPGAAKPSAAKPAGTKPAGIKPAAKAPGKPATASGANASANGNGRGPASNGTSGSNGAASNGDGSGGPSGPSGMLRRLRPGRAEPAPEPEEPEVTIVRQQQKRQSRSKRSGKR